MENNQSQDAIQKAVQEDDQAKKFSLEDLLNVWDAAKGGSNRNGRYVEKYPKFNDFFKDYAVQEYKPQQDAKRFEPWYEDFQERYKNESQQDAIQKAKTREEISLLADQHVLMIKEAMLSLGERLNNGAVAGHRSGYFTGYTDAMKEYLQSSLQEDKK